MEKDNNLMIAASILFSGIMISAAILYGGDGVGIKKNNPTNQPTNQNPGNNQASVEITDRDVILGNKDAKVAVIIYSDYQCPFCGKFFTDTESKIKQEYVNSGKVKLVHRNFAFLDQFPGVTGEESHLAAEAAECAKDQGKFWNYHDALFQEEIRDGQENNGNLKKDLFVRLAQNLSLDIGAFERCIDERKYKDLIAEDTENASSLGISSTPTVYVNKVQIKGAQPFENFKAEIDRALQES